MKIFIYYLLMITTTYAGALKWDRQSQDIEVVTSTQKKESFFTYTNTSSKEITFIKIKASCGCVLVDAPQKVAPGKSGKITFKAPIPRAGGNYGKTISVDTNEKEGVDYTLTFKVINTDKPEVVANAFKAPSSKSRTPINSRPHRYPTQQGYTRLSPMTKRGLIVEKLLAKQALSKKRSYTKQIDCPFLPLPISLKLYHDFQGLRIYTCCEQCLVKLKESPHHAIIKLAEKAQTPISIP